MADMTKRWKKVAERVGRVVGYKTKSYRAELLAAAAAEKRAGKSAEQDAAKTEEKQHAGWHYLRP